MKDNRILLLKEKRGNAYRRLFLEQGTSDEDDFDYVNSLKQGLAKNAIIFTNGFVSAIILSIIMGLIIFGLIMYKLLF